MRTTLRRQITEVSENKMKEGETWRKKVEGGKYKCEEKGGI